MADEEYYAATRQSTVQLKDGTHRSVAAGEPVRKSDLSEFFQEQLGDESTWTGGLFEPSDEKSYEDWQAGHRAVEQKDFDRERWQELGNMTLPGPDEIAVVQDGDLVIEERRKSELPHTHATSKVTTEGPEADEALNQAVGLSSGEAAPPAEEEEKTEKKKG